MWNPEARDFSPIIFTFMSSWERTKMPPPPGRRRTRSNGAGKFTAVEDFARYSVEAVQEAAAAGKEGDKVRRRREGGEQGVAV
jgi:hypothetical protein